MMKYLLLLAAVLFTSLSYGQGIWNKSATNTIVNRGKDDSVRIIPRDTLPTNNALYNGSPVGNYARIAAKHGLFYFHDSIRNRRVAFYDDISGGFVPNSRTINIIGGTDISAVGGTQDLSANRTWNINNTSTFESVSGRGNTTSVPIYVMGNFIDIQGAAPFLGFNDGASSIRGENGDLLNVVDTTRFFKVINGVGGIEMLSMDYNKGTFNVPLDGVSPPAGAIALEIPVASWVRARINDSTATQNLQNVTNKGNTTTLGINAMGFRSINAPGADGHSFANGSDVLRWLIRGANAEGGSNSGYDLVINARSDGGGNIGDAATFKRSNGFLGLGTGTPTSRLHVAGSFATAAIVITATTTLDATHHNVDVNNSANVVVNLPAISTCPGREYTVSKASNNAFTVTITANGAETINGINTFVISTQYASATIWNTGVEWRIK